MKCVLDLTVNLKAITADGTDKLLVTINNESLIERQFRQMKQAGISSVFVLLPAGYHGRSLVSRVAMQYHYRPTFIEVESDYIKRKNALVLTKDYLKESFIYWPVNRVIESRALQQLVAAECSSHQLVSLVDNSLETVHQDKPSIFKAHYDPATNTRIESQQPQSGSKYGYDLGVYKCSPIIFSIIGKLTKNSLLSWNKVHSVFSRAKRSLITHVENQFWGVIETKQDVKHLEQLRVQSKLSSKSENAIDKVWLTPNLTGYAGWLEKQLLARSRGYETSIAIVVLSVLTLTFAHPIINMILAPLIFVAIISYPYLVAIAQQYRSSEEPSDNAEASFLSKLNHQSILVLARLAFGAAISVKIIVVNDYDLPLTAILFTLIFFLLFEWYAYRHTSSNLDQQNSLTDSFAVHAAVFSVSLLLVYPIATWLVFYLSYLGFVIYYILRKVQFDNSSNASTQS
ncbi:MAG: hypothetical protein V2I33_05235 [Kangiellaceae bacterium]|jgi:choline kinase|nr:hypothetical protein [Kangiellaceae bacterium]